MNIFKLIIPDTESAMASVGKQKKAAEDILARIEGYVPKVKDAWTGGDELEFEADVNRKLKPAMQQLIMALNDFTGVLGKMIDAITSADQKTSGLISKLGDMFGGILK